MKSIKRVLSALLVLTFCIGFAACSSESNNGGSTKTSSEAPDTWDYTPNTDPPRMEVGTDEDSEYLKGVKNEIAYDKIVVKINKDTFSLKNDKQIDCEVTNMNPGHGFYVYLAPAIEKQVDGKWERICNKYMTQTEGLERWMCVATENEPDMTFSVKVGVSISDFVPAAAPSHYRLVIFTAKTTLYAEFDIVE